MNKPSFMIIGAQKSGTSSLNYFLQQHPRLQPGREKELNYFSLLFEFGHTIEEYYSFFPSCPNKDKPLFYDATPEYLYRKDVPSRIHKYLDDIKFIVILREPVSRAYSAWNMFKAIFYENRDLLKNRINSPELGFNIVYHFLFENRKNFPSFSEAMKIEFDAQEKGFEEPSMVRRGRYIEQLRRYWQYFPKENFLILGMGELQNDTIGTLNKILTFLELEPTNWNFLDKAHINTRKYEKRIDGKDKAFLDEYYKPFNEELFSEIGEINWGKNE